jgi:hypothetical protein
MIQKYLLPIIATVALLFPAGCAKDEAGNYHLDPGVRDQLIAVAQAQAHAIATSYLQTGNIDFKKDLISGALSQVYTLEGTTTPATKANVTTVIGNVIKDPYLKAAVADAAIKTIEAVPSGTAKNTGITNALIALDTAIGTIGKPSAAITKSTKVKVAKVRHPAAKIKTLSWDANPADQQIIAYNVYRVKQNGDSYLLATVTTPSYKPPQPNGKFQVTAVNIRKESDKTGIVGP